MPARGIARALRSADLRRPIFPGPAALIKLGLQPMRLVPEPLLTPDAIDFINQPATVDLAPLLARMPRRLTTFDEGLATYLPPDAGPATLEFDRGTGPSARSGRWTWSSTASSRSTTSK